ncbi:MAG: dihydroneopterin aldolase [Betaproteobacteria bacterium]|nr:dihydroneopterin aldolase [Betaproteobacteria bacterium]
MDTIFLRELKLETLVGVYQWERRIPQMIQVDLDIGLPDGRACVSDRIKDTIDYSLIVKRIRETLKNRHFVLVEALAEHIAQLILKEFTSPWVRVSVAKLGVIRGVKQIGVTVERGARPVA